LRGLASWWEQERPNLVKLAEEVTTVYDPPVLVETHSKYQKYEIYAVEVVEEPAVFARRDVLRAFLTRLGLEVRVSWEPTGLTKPREPKFRITDIDITAAVDLASLPGFSESGCSTTINPGWRR
jgi:hypothetical protein